MRNLLLFMGWLICFGATAAETPRKSAEELSKLLGDKDSKVKIEASHEIAKLGVEGKPAAKALVEALRDNDPQVSAASLEALVAMGPPAIHALAEALKPPPSNEFLGGGSSGGKNADKVETQDVKELIEILKGSDLMKRMQAARILGELGPKAKAAVPALIEAIPTSKGMVISSIIKALGRIGPDAKDAVPVIIPFLKFNKENQNKPALMSDRMNARFAAYALAAIDPKAKGIEDAARIIAQTVQDKDMSLDGRNHAEAISALQSIGTPAVQVLAEIYIAKSKESGKTVDSSK